MTESIQIAYLREFEAKQQCELMFELCVDLKEVGVLKEEVRAVRQVTDTVESLLQHTINKIRRSIKCLRADNETIETDEIKVTVALRNGKKLIKPKMVLKNLINSPMKNMEFHIFNQCYVVVINAPLVREIKLPSILYAHFTIQASRLQVLFTENNKCQYCWLKSKDKENWVQIATTPKYKPVDDDIDHYLKLVCVPSNAVLTGPPAEVVSENTVEIIGDLPTCPFEKRHKFTTKKLDKKRLVSYNVLSHRYTDSSDAFPYCSRKSLAPDYRKQLIAKELLGYQADVICLQEVDSLLYSSYYKDAFKNKDYMSFYHRKGNKISEGLACFFDKSRFKKVDDRQIIYSNEIKHRMFTYLWNFVKGNPDLKECFMKQLTSLQITVLKRKARGNNEYFIIGNTHLFYHPDAELVRIVQVNIATNYLHFLFKQYSESREKENVKVTVILCGDFNSVPTSAVYEYIEQGRLGKTHDVFKNTKNNIDLYHNFRFESACGIPKYTNYTDDFKNCLDYIFIERNKIKVKNVVPFPTEEELAKYEGLPNDVYPSDHLALVVDLDVI